MNMNKLISLALCLVALLTLLVGCDSEVPSGNLSSLEKVPTSTQSETRNTEETLQDTTPAENTSYLGRMEGGIYENTYIGYGCKLDSNWTFATAEELQDLPENTAELFKDTELEANLAKYTQITDMMAENVNDLTSINILYQKLDLATRAAFTGLNEDAIADAILEQSETWKSSFAQAGIEVASFEKVKVTFLGEEHTAILMTSTMQGVPYYTLQIQDYTLGQYGVTLTLASYMENKTESLLDLFYAV